MTTGNSPNQLQPTIKERLQELARENPSAHPYTLSLLLSARTGIQISGAHAVKLLEP